MGCVNINLVTPTHYVPQIVAALARAVRRGLDLPVVYNCGGYESLDILTLLDGVIDVYLPDAKFATRGCSRALCGAPDYPERMVAALAEMQRQVGRLLVDSDGVARTGLLIRHLVMPGHLSDTERMFRLLADRVSSSACVNVMAQYRPCGDVLGIEGPLGQTLSPDEYRSAVSAASAAGLSLIG